MIVIQSKNIMEKQLDEASLEVVRMKDVNRKLQLQLQVQSGYIA